MGNKCSASKEKSLSRTDFNAIKSSNQPLYVLTTYFNPGHFKIRSKLYEEFKTKVNFLSSQNVHLFTVECAFGTDDFEVTKPNNEPYDIQLRTPKPLFLKENLLNLAIKRLQSDDKFIKSSSNCFIAWIDHDIDLIDLQWAEKIKMSLKKYSIVQIFKNCQCVGTHNEIMENRTSFGSCYLSAPSALQTPSVDPGYGWATTKENLINLGSLFQANILGLGDRQMAFGLIGTFNEGFDKNKMSYGYEQMMFEWMKKAETVFKKNIGFVDMIIRHKWHGNPSNRGRDVRWQILKDWNYDPTTDLQVFQNGILVVTEEKEGLVTAIGKWFLSRAEDEVSKPAAQVPQQQVVLKPVPQQQQGGGFKPTQPIGVQMQQGEQGGGGYKPTQPIGTQVQQGGYKPTQPIGAQIKQCEGYKPAQPNGAQKQQGGGLKPKQSSGVQKQQTGGYKPSQISGAEKQQGGSYKPTYQSDEQNNNFNLY